MKGLLCINGSCQLGFADEQAGLSAQGTRTVQVVDTLLKMVPGEALVPEDTRPAIERPAVHEHDLKPARLGFEQMQDALHAQKM